MTHLRQLFKSLTFLTLLLTLLLTAVASTLIAVASTQVLPERAYEPDMRFEPLPLAHHTAARTQHLKHDIRLPTGNHLSSGGENLELVGQIGGPSLAVAVEGNYAYTHQAFQ